MCVARLDATSTWQLVRTIPHHQHRLSATRKAKQSKAPSPKASKGVVCAEKGCVGVGARAVAPIWGSGELFEPPALFLGGEGGESNRGREGSTQASPLSLAPAQLAAGFPKRVSARSKVKRSSRLRARVQERREASLEAEACAKAHLLAACSPATCHRIEQR